MAGQRHTNTLRLRGCLGSALGAVLAVMSILTYSTACVAEGQALGLAQRRGQDSALLGGRQG
jgi:hypothetical protein